MNNQMILKLPQLIMTLLIFVLSINNAIAVELITWDRTPIKITINQNDERMVILERNISVGLPISLQAKLRVQSLGGVLYLKSNAPFTETRLMLKDLESGEIILIDLTGNGPSKKKLETIKITTEDEANLKKIEENYTTVHDEQALPTPVLLTRYAAQNYYAPLRAIEKVPGIKQISMSLPPILTRLVPQLPITAEPKSVWRLKNYEVVAIKLVNYSKGYVNLDARLLQGNFYSATFQHNILGPQGEPADTTMLYIVTKGKVINAFLPELNGRGE
ncbi:TIGR03749 family integrating conjugative element protein [Gilliamella sp. B2776]|uniref:TIGR03749 family integrating conjugative element protein n=1 Tax=unclassified Gilliamella TaxID=2685620 RepID=UPI00226AEABF|nr:MULTISPECIES: TIGR03749 family integrating conjugative element protein [unclassified Gilliamella]MCX8578702.1 TIGR03749 family integrating conjugative element protein [Gilliamella sp. B2717]MCX8649584.1 TIGR03749 family integrating conjugative element protein [Gilliamella sp. B2779]MCX8654898.1 TIGR03749 family integrating conjugative element protein [Gilliamella sp. B2737]MCX8691426.1 TIGR03749 family integrating conjugative element protein [Gilliamella sp. B2776]MCX8702513.1 TIGR03749 fam